MGRAIPAVAIPAVNPTAHSCNPDASERIISSARNKREDEKHILSRRTKSAVKFYHHPVEILTQTFDRTLCERINPEGISVISVIGVVGPVSPEVPKPFYPNRLSNLIFFSPINTIIMFP